jgi:hypothetical protein
VTSLIEIMRNAVSEGSENGMLVAADALQESDDATNNRMGELLRCYVDIQTYVRTSMPIPISLGERYTELQNTFNSKATRRIDDEDWSAEYFKPLGVYYTGLRASLRNLDNNPNLLSIEPVRDLEVRACYSGEALKKLFRNYRMGYIQRLSLRFERGYSSGTRPGNTVEIADAMFNLLGEMMEHITILGVDDRLKKIQVMFMSNRKIRKGCRLSIATRVFGSAERADHSQIKK